MTDVVQIQKKRYLLKGTTILLRASSLLSDYRKMKTKRGRASEKCCKKAGRSSPLDSEVWRPRIKEHTMQPSQRHERLLR